MKIEELEKELEEEVAQFKASNKSGIQLDSEKVRWKTMFYQPVSNICKTHYYL